MDMSSNNTAKKSASINTFEIKHNNERSSIDMSSTIYEKEEPKNKLEHIQTNKKLIQNRQLSRALHAQVKKQQHDFDKCYDHIIKTMDTKITMNNIIKIIAQCMKVVQTFDKLNGIEKKDLVIDVLQKMIKDSDHNEDLENILIDVLERIGHPVIDTLIAASKGKLFGKLKKRWCGWIKGCKI